MNMTTSIDSIPMKTSNKNNDNYNDDSDDPMVKDILNEFQQELEINTQKQPVNVNQKNNYNINYNQENLQEPDINKNMCNINKQKKPQQSYYNEDYIKKSIILTIIVFIIFSPIFFPMISEKLPLSISIIFETYELYIKLLILFIFTYILYFYNFL
jgi:hypothetical protein